MMAGHKSESNSSSRLKKAVEIDLRSEEEEEEEEGWSVAGSLREFGESMLRRQVMEAEMIKARESARIQTDNQRLERETELTQMMLNTQLQITSFLISSHSTKRKRHTHSLSLQREGAMLPSLMHFHFGI